MLPEMVSPFTLPLLEWCDIPGGKVTLDGEPKAFEVRPFLMARYPVSNHQYDAFIQDGGYKHKQWWVGLEQTGGSPRASDWREAECPKLQVCWFEAVAFCRWLGHHLAQPVRLPTEWEWQWAAAGDTGWAYSYGNEFDLTKCSTKESGIGRTHGLTAFSGIPSPFGLVDMSGHVWEWCLNEWADLEHVFVNGSENRAVRGGSWHNGMHNARVAYRASRTPRTRTFNLGFRVMIGDEL